MANATLNNQNMFLNLILIVLTIGAWFGTDEVTKRLNTVPIKTVPKTAPALKPVDSKTRYPVLVEFKKRVEKKEDEGEIEVDNVFHKKETVIEKKETVLPPIDHVAQIASSLKLGGIGMDGAFINNTYYRVNDPIFAAARMIGTNKVVPKLVRIGQNDVGVQIDKKVISLKYD